MGKIDGGKTKAKRTHQRCDGQHDPNRDRQSGQLGKTIGDQPIRANNPDRPRRSRDKPGRSSDGGIIRQLIAETQNQLAAREVECEQLRIRVAELTALLRSVENAALR